MKAARSFYAPDRFGCAPWGKRSKHRFGPASPVPREGRTGKKHCYFSEMAAVTLVPLKDDVILSVFGVVHQKPVELPRELLGLRTPEVLLRI